VDQKVVDFDNLDDHRIAFDGADFAICCLGTTRGKAGKDGFVKVTKEKLLSGVNVVIL
jgi:oxidoreductase